MTQHTASKNRIASFPTVSRRVNLNTDFIPVTRLSTAGISTRAIKLAAAIGNPRLPLHGRIDLTSVSLGDMLRNLCKKGPELLRQKATAGTRGVGLVQAGELVAAITRNGILTVSEAEAIYHACAVNGERNAAATERACTLFLSGYHRIFQLREKKPD